MFQAIERRVQRALLNLKLVAGNLLDAQEHAVAVERSERDGLEDEKVERPLQQLRVAAICSPRMTRRSYYSPPSMSRRAPAMTRFPRFSRLIL